MLVPTERGELNGPYFQATHDGFKIPFFSQDFSAKFGNGGAGRYGRDDGVTLWSSAEPGFIKGTLGYAFGVYRGLQSSGFAEPNQGGNVFNAHISAYYQHGDLFTKGLNYAPDVANRAVDVFKISFQLQI